MSEPAVSGESLARRRFQLFAGRSLRLISVTLVVLATIVWLAVLQLPDGRLHVAFLDVGQGDAILITAPEGQQVLVDGGPNPTQILRELGQQLPFWDSTIDMVVLTHADADHMTGLVPLLERYRVQHLLASAQSLGAEEARYLWAAVEGGRVEVTQAARGMRVMIGDAVELEILHPEAVPLAGYTDNNSSVVVRLKYGATSFLLTGDLESRGEAHLLRSGQVLSAQVLKVSHHGSGGATTDRFLEAVSPWLAVIQVGEGNHFGHPSPALLERLADAGVRTLRTDTHGTIEVVSDGWSLQDRTETRRAGVP
jgi:competence protein ComEC